MEKIFKILAVFALLILIIVFSVYARERKFREFYFSKRIPLPRTLEASKNLVTVVVSAEEDGGRRITDAENQLSIHLEEEWDNPDHAVDSPVHTGKITGKRLLVAKDDRTGNIVATLALSESPDVLLFDPVTRLIFGCNTAGVLTIIQQTSRETYKVVQYLTIPIGCNSLSLDMDSGKLYVLAEGSLFVYANN